MTTPADIADQREVCEEFNSGFCSSPDNMKVGISRNVEVGISSINGLRHSQQGDTTGWYIWAGEEWSDDPDFFQPLHVDHIKDWHPQIIKYLGLEPGFRFLLADDYIDVWKDDKLIE